MSETIEIHNARRLDGTPTAVTFRDGRILAGGTPDRRIDAGGRVLLPGLCESHLHLFPGGVTLDQLCLLGIDNAEDASAALIAYRKGHEGEPLLGTWSANYEILGPGTRPDRHALDRIVPDQPLLMLAVDLHTAWANTAALTAAGLMAHVPEVVNAEVVLGPDGKPNGELREGNAMRLVSRLSVTGGREGICMAGEEPENVTPAQRAADKAALRRALDTCAAFGITTAVNMDGNLYQADLLTEMAMADELPIRVSLPMRIVGGHSDARVAELIEAACRPPVGMLSFGRIKMFMDGVFDTWTALRTDDYPGRPGFRSHPLFEPARFADICTRADAKGLNIQVHCVGDGAVRATLDGYAAARAANGARDARHRIEHIDMLHPDDLPRIVDLGVVASMQPVHPPGSSGLPLEPTVSIMGRNRWKDAFPWKALRDAGVPLAFGTDWPTAPLSPFNAIHSTLSRQPWAADVPDQRIPFEAVFAAYTEGGAYPLFAETERGRLDPGMAADMTLLDGNPRDLAQSADACRAVLTICAGRIVHEAS
ncbi:amidohydrolase [Paenirhodobacter sp.]|uniref:amidohydrolase n=1 Tax=Paenirhodobacter sp. TaxID=1965326 RepID=UPI003B3E53B5